MTIDLEENVQSRQLFSTCFDAESMPLSLDLPVLDTLSISHYGEIARWLLAQANLPYRENISTLSYFGATQFSQPYLRWGDRQWHGSEAILKQFLMHISLTPTLNRVVGLDFEQERALLRRILDDLAPSISQLTAVLMRRSPGTFREALKYRLPPIESALTEIFYPIWSKRFRRNLSAENLKLEEIHRRIEENISDIECLIGKGYKLLGGDNVCYLDILLAATLAPAFYPLEFLGKLPPLDKLPLTHQNWVKRMRATAVGVRVLNLYENHLPPAAMSKEGRSIPDFTGVQPQIAQANVYVQRKLLSKQVLTPVFSVLRKWKPVLTIGQAVVLSKREHVIEALENPSAISVKPIYAERILRDSGDFVLGMDPCPRHTREKELLTQTVLQDDLARIQQMTRGYVQQVLQARQPLRNLNLVQDYSRLVILKIVAEEYIGFKADNEPLQAHWLKSLFEDIFFNFAEDLSTKQIAAQAAEEMKAELLEVIANYRNQLEREENLPDNVLVRMVRLQNSMSWLDDDTIRRNVSGLLVGSLETLNMAVVKIVQELLSRPSKLALAKDCALHGDDAGLLNYCYEALRLNPVNPILFRSCAKEWTLSSNGQKEFTIEEGSFLVLGLLSAERDSNHCLNSDSFDAHRSQPSLQLGWGIHHCLGLPLSEVMLVEMVRGLLLLKNLKPAEGKSGRIAYKGALPNRWILNFDY